MIDISSEELESLRKSIEICYDSGYILWSVDLLKKLGFNENNSTFLQIKEEIDQENIILKFKQSQEDLLLKKLR